MSDRLDSSDISENDNIDKLALDGLHHTTEHTTLNNNNKNNHINNTATITTITATTITAAAKVNTTATTGAIPHLTSMGTPHTFNNNNNIQKVYKHNEYETSFTTNGSVAFPLASLPIPKWYRLSSSWIFILMFSILISLGTLLSMMDSFTNYQKDSNGCKDSYMRPLYIKQDEFDSEMTRFAGKYALYLYREKGVDLSEQPTGIPVLFIPGHAGSYKQIRSIAAESAYYYYQHYARNMDSWDHGMRNLDFFTVDFNEEFSALHGQSLLEQAEYLNDAIDYILKLYPSSRKWGPPQNKHLPDPTSVIIVGHSMGGVVARTMLTLHNYQPGTINTILTLSTPHILPPAPFDWKITQIYKQIHQFWKVDFDHRQQQHQQYQQVSSVQKKATSSSPTGIEKYTSGVLKDVSLISIAGGNLDAIICSDTANVGTFLPRNHGFTVFPTGIPNVWTGTDHNSILTCNQMVKVISKTLLNIVDARRGSQTKPLDERMKVMEKAFLSGLEDRRGDGSDLELDELSYHDLNPNQSQFLLPGQRLILDNEDYGSQRMIFLPVYEGADAFSILTNQVLGKHEAFDLYLCNKLENHIKGTTRMGCRSVSPSISTTIPASTTYEKEAHNVSTFMFASITFEEMHDYEFLCIIDRRNASPGFLIAEPYDFDTNTRIIDKSIFDIAMNGIQLDLNSALYSTIRIPSIDSSMLSYHMNIRASQCSSTHFAPLLRQSIATMHESKFFVDVGYEKQNIGISVHGRTAFSPPSPPIRLLHHVQHQNKQRYSHHLEEELNGLTINLWMDPSCNQPVKIEILIDWYGSLGRIGFRNGVMLPTYVFIVVMIVWVNQLRCYFNTGIYPHFGQGMVYCMRTVFPLISVLLTLATIYQGWTDDEVYQLIDNDRLLGTWLKQYVAANDDTSGIKPMSIVWNDVLSGRVDLFFWWLPLFGLIVSIGVVIILWVLLSALMHISTTILSFFVGYHYHTNHHHHHQKQQCSNNYQQLLWFFPTNFNSESDRQRLERKVITTFILFSLVATCIPYQFVFLVALLVLIITCIRALLKSKFASPNQELKKNNRYYYLQSLLLLFVTLLPFNAPILVVWIRNLSVHWFVPFSSDHSVLAIAPIMIYVEMLTNQKTILPRMTLRIWHWSTYMLFYMIVTYAFLYGIRYTHSLYFLSNGLIGWLLFLHFWHSPYGCHVYHYLMEHFYPFTKKKS
ncbi:PGAP1-like protein-domain-containing protein [Cunninghamella echinulata]|nr:PGAP1-like protein-domain-containing protein [Cunninghamella echinulata]